MTAEIDIKSNLSKVYANIERAAKRSGRDVNDITLIAVSKTKPVSMIKECIECGTVIFGENKAQEMASKIAELHDDNLNWHFIGHLQRNKVKYVVGNACMIHSVDSVRLAEAINAEAVKKGVICDILIEVNIACEDTKFGIKAEDIYDFIDEIRNFPNIKIRGLMTIAPYVDNPEDNRVHFRHLRNLLVDINSKNIDNVYMDVLSMGMTGDYEVAVEEGATIVRVGTGIFGDRIYV